jgi:hypothetical protein
MDEKTGLGGEVYVRDDFINGSAPFEEVYALRENPLEFLQAKERMAAIAKACGVPGFKTLFKAYCETVKMADGGNFAGNASSFENQPIEIETGQWYADDNGISRINKYGFEEVACVHPIMPVHRYTDIDTGIEKLVIAFRRDDEWRTIMCERGQIASANKIVDLANKGVAVTSENAKTLVQYLSDAENLNLKRIPANKSVGRMGWIGDDFFSPYVDGLIYDGDENYKYLYEAICSKGKYEDWVEFVKGIRAEGNVPAKMILAASFASVLVKPCNRLPFFLHLWGGSGNGKTCALMLAASVWGNPAVGEYINTFNSTAVGQEQLAGFLNSMPLIFDEMQIQTSDSRKDFDSMIYQLTEGVGRIRGAKEGGIRSRKTWRNCILTSGEQPIMTAKSGGGAVNRVIEIDTSGVQFFEDAKKVADFLIGCYGHAGEKFVKILMDPDNIEMAKKLQSDYFEKMFQGGDVTEKQALAGSLILTADALIDAEIFKDGNGLGVGDVKKFLVKNADIDIGKRAHEWLCEWLAQNDKKFIDSDNNAETWGRKVAGATHIIRSVYDKACSENGYNSTVALGWLRDKGLIETEGRNLTKRVRINGTKCQCVILKNIDFELDGFQEVIDEDEIPW